MKTSKKEYLFYSPAKINLNLHILATRKDGYHELETDIIPIELWDTFTLFPATEKKMQKNYNLSNKEDLIYKAIQLLEQNTKKSLTYHLKIEKFIPMGAGLGGGSSNAAAILFAFNQIFSLGFSLEKLAQLGKKLGADVPFFLHQKQLRMGAIGTRVIQDIEILPYPLLLLLPNFQSNTKEAYQGLSSQGLFCQNLSNKNKDENSVSSKVLQKYSLSKIKKISVKNNDLYSVVLKKHPSLKTHLQMLETTQPLATQMSGSGSSLFAIYETTAQRDKAYNSLQNSKPEKREQKNPSSKKTEQTFTLYKTQILPTFDFFNKP